MEKMKNISISFIVPVYNVEDYLERCIISIMNQGIKESKYEIILVNDGSTDRSLEVCKSYEKRFNCVKCYSQKNQGLSVARNTGIDYADGKYIMFVDSDDFLEPMIVPCLIEKADELDSDLLFFQCKTYPYNNEILNVQPFELNKTYNGEYVLLHGMKVSSVWSNIYNSNFLKGTKIRFFPGIYGEDIDFNYRLYPKAKKIVFSDALVYNYVINVESITRTTNKLKLEKRVLDSLIIVKNIFVYINTADISIELKDFYKRIMNSSLAGTCIKLLTDRSLYSTDFAKRFLEQAETNGLYPIEGKTKSFKSTLLLPLLNNKRLYLFLERIIH